MIILDSNTWVVCGSPAYFPGHWKLAKCAEELLRLNIWNLDTFYPRYLMLNDDHNLKSVDPKSENSQYGFKCWEPKVLSHWVLAWVRVEQVPNPNLFQGSEVYQPDWCASVWGLTQPLSWTYASKQTVTASGKGTMLSIQYGTEGCWYEYYKRVFNFIWLPSGSLLVPDVATMK